MDLWYKSVTIYSLDVETFFDSDGDGIGDFRGLTQKLPYLKQLGIDCLWLLPFYPSPNRDNGYDVSDFTSVDSRLGTFHDFQEFVKEAKQNGIYVLIDLVVNHTSEQHPWFQEACRDRQSPYREYYIWSDHIPEGKHETIFPGEEDQTWSWNEQAGQYYLHRFYKEQPDLNVHNAKVKEEIRRIMKFWLEQGIAGFRVDAVHILIQVDLPHQPQPTDNETIMNDMRRWIEESNPSAVLLAEANDDIEKLSRYFGKGDRMHLLFDFISNQYVFHALATHTTIPLKKAIQQLAAIPIPSSCNYVNFIRKHDELNLGKLKPEEREEVFNVFAPEERMRIYGRGIRRRLAPMLNNDRQKIEVMYSLMFSLPGTSLIRYGDEIGMGENLHLKGRESIRTVMQWSSGVNGGFSTAKTHALVTPVISGGDFGFENVNVARQLEENNSMLHWMRRMIHCRKELNVTSMSKFVMLDSEHEAVIAFMYEEYNTRFLTFHNVSETPVTCELPDGLGRLTSCFGNGVINGSKLLLGRYGYAWLKTV